MPSVLDAVWLRVSDRRPQVVTMYRRHYSARQYRDGRRNWWRTGIVGPGEKCVLMTVNGDAIFAWLRPQFDKSDGHRGVRCTVFRNEGGLLSSDLIRAADEIAWQRWPDEWSARHYTWIEDSKVRSTNPGYCFKMAGWVYAGRNKDGRLTLLERFPEEARDG